MSALLANMALAAPKAPCAVAPRRGAAVQVALPAPFLNGSPLQHAPALPRRAPAAQPLPARGALQCAAAATNGAAPAATNGNGNGAAASSRPSAAETARTIVDLAAHGTLCTLSEDGIPLGTYVSYVLDQEGQPILRLRADAVHTANLVGRRAGGERWGEPTLQLLHNWVRTLLRIRMGALFHATNARSPADPLLQARDAKCSLFVQPSEHPARLLARVTLIGAVEPVSAEVAERAAALHNTLHAGGVGVDAPQPSDLYFRLKVGAAECVYMWWRRGPSSTVRAAAGTERAAGSVPPCHTPSSSLTCSCSTHSALCVGPLRLGARVVGAKPGAPLRPTPPSPPLPLFHTQVDRCFYVGQMGAESTAEVLPGDAYRSAEPDALRTVALSLTQHMNSERLEDVMRIWWVVL